jgi:hypothetical protein
MQETLILALKLSLNVPKSLCANSNYRIGLFCGLSHFNWVKQWHLPAPNVEGRAHFFATHCVRVYFMHTGHAVYGPILALAA